ncbi:reverse transcriptase domain-containing protein [Tanacetum coccineum]|uniref:Reverse transcriptase domain-containing protein n=1 Tax=Tanacetum coccineum TaxID=301880 RepID=A0ABQ5DU30_9ASTR
MSDNIPYEIQLEIIKKVPDVKSLIRLRSVSKEWKSLIDSFEFITSYGDRDTQPHSFLLRYKEAGDPREVTTPRTEMVVIWNPSIRTSVGIVLPCDLTNISGKLARFGFGVCPSTYDPTIVKLSFSFEGKDTVKWQVEIFSLSSKTWKMIVSSNLPRKSVALFRFSTQVAIDRKPPRSISKTSIAYDRGEEGGVMTSFTKLFNIKTPFDSPLSEVLGFSMSGEPILETEKEYGKFAKVEVYKPYSEHINDFGITGVNGSFFVCPYTETLLLTDHSDSCIISNDY